MGLDGMPDLNPWIDLHPERESARADRQLTQSDRAVVAMVTGTPESDSSIPAGSVEVTIPDSLEPPVVAPADGGITAVGAVVLCARDSSGRIVKVSEPVRLPGGAVPAAVGVTGERLVQLDATTAALDAGLESAQADLDAAKAELDGKLAENTSKIDELNDTTLPGLVERVGTVESAAEAAQARADLALANAQEFIINGSFSDGFTGWGTHIGGTVKASGLPSPTMASHVSAANGAHINDGEFPALPGRTYRVRFKAKADADQSILYIRFSAFKNGSWSDTAVQLDPPKALSTVWADYAIDYTVPASSTYEKFRLRFTRDTGWWLTGVSVRDVTEAVAAQAAADKAQVDADALKPRVSTLETGLATAQSQLTAARSSLDELNTATLPGLQDDMRDAARLTEGTLDNARLNVGTLAAQIANVIQLNVSRLVADSSAINTAVINKLAVAIANVIELNADRITAGTIDTSRLDAQTVAAAIAQFLQLDVGQLTADTANIGDAVAQKIWAGVAKFAEITTEMLTAGHAVITGDMMVDTLIGKILSGAVLTAGGGSLPQVLVGPASGVPGQGDSYGVYISTPNNNATGSAHLAVTPMGPSLAFYNSAGAETFFVDGAGNIRILNATDGGTVDLSAMATQRWQWDSSQQGSVQVTFNSTSGWSAWAFFDAANNNVTIPSIATVTSPTGRFRIDCGWELPSESTYDNTLMQLQFGFYTTNPNNFSRTDITNSLLGNLGRANAAGPGIVGVHSGQGSEVFTGNANTTYWVRPFYRQRVMSSNVTGIFNRMWASITPA